MKHTVWARLGISIELDKPLESFANEDELVEAAIKSIQAKQFEVEGDAYIPGCCLDDEDLQFDYRDDLELGSFYQNEQGEIL
jgi:hypothetical protein